MSFIESIVSLILDIAIILIIVRAVLSFLPQYRYKYREFYVPVERLTEPMLAPFRRLIPPQKTGGLDLSPILAIVAIQIIRAILL